MHFARNFDARLRRVVARGFRPAARIFRNAAGLRRVGLMLRRIPVGRPFPDVADHVEEAVAIGRKRRHRRRAREAVSQVFCRGNSPCQVFAICLPPGVNHRPRRSVPSSPPRAANSHSASVGSPCRPISRRPRVGIRHMHDRMIVEPADIAPRPKRMAPIAPPERPTTAASRADRPGDGGENTSDPHRAYAAARRDSPSGREEFRQR